MSKNVEDRYIKVLSKDVQIDEHYWKEVKKIIAEAEQMIVGRFIFNNIWDMEPCDNPVANIGLRWDIRYDGDPEWTYMFTRFDYSFKLIIAYEATQDRKYIEYGLRWIKAWYRSNSRFLYRNIGKALRKLDRGKTLAHRTLDLAILVVNIADYSTYCYQNQLIDEATYEKHKWIAKSICKYVYDTDREFKTLTNWGPIENGFVLYAGEVFGLNFHTNVLVTRLQKQVGVQILPDGSHTESSPMYLVEVLLPLLKCIRFCKNVDLSLISEAVKRGCNYLQSIATPDCCIPNIGDSDLVNISDLMIIAHELFDDPKYLTTINRNLSIEYMYKFRMHQLKQSEVIGRYWDEFETRTDLQHQKVIRDKDHGLYIICNNIPYGPSGHKHYDYLSFLLYVYEKPVLIDCGRETYKDGEVRRQSKSPVSHNTVAINEEEYWHTVDAWTVNQKVSDHIIKSLDSNSVLMGCTLGENEIRISRVLSYISGIGIIITDIIEGNNYKKYEAYFNVAPSAVVEKNIRGITIQTDSVFLYYGNSINAANLADGRCSSQYNTGYPNKRIICEASSRVISHYLMFREITIDCVYKDGRLEYVNVDTREVVLAVTIPRVNDTIT